MPALADPATENDLGDFSQFVPASTPEPSPDESLGEFSQFVPPPTSTAAYVAPADTGLGEFSQFVPQTPTSESEKALAETPKWAVAGATVGAMQNAIPTIPPSGYAGRGEFAADANVAPIVPLKPGETSVSSFKEAMTKPALSLPPVQINKDDSEFTKVDKTLQNIAKGFVSGATSPAGAMALLSPFIAGATIVSNIPNIIEKLKEADKTPAFSTERHEAAAEVVTMILPFALHGIVKSIRGEPSTTASTPEARPAVQTLPETRLPVTEEAAPLSSDFLQRPETTTETQRTAPPSFSESSQDLEPQTPSVTPEVPASTEATTESSPPQEDLGAAAEAQPTGVASEAAAAPTPVDMPGFGPGAAVAEEIPLPKEVSIRNARVDEERTARGQLPLMQPARKAMGKTWDEAMQRLEREPDLGNQMTTDILNGDKKAVSESDHAVLMHEKIRVMNERDMEADRSTDLQASEEERTEAHARWATLEDRINDIDHATQEAGTISGRALQFRQAIARDDYTFSGMERRARAAKGGPLTKTESAGIKQKAEEISKTEEAAQTQAGVDEGKRGDQAAEVAIRELRSRKGEAKAIDRNKILDRMRAAAEKGIGGKDFSSAMQRIALSFVRDGITKREPLLQAVHDFTKDVTGFDPRATRDAVSGYGEFKPLDKETAKVQLREIKGESQQLSKLEDMAKGEAPLKTGIERRAMSDDERKLVKEVNEAKKKGGFSVTDPETQLRSALDSIKTRLRNQIKDLTRQVETGVRDIRERKAPPSDDETGSLRTERDELKKRYDEIFGPEINDAQRLARAKGYLERRATELERRIRDNDFAPRAKPEPVRLDTPGMAFKSKVERLKEQFEVALSKERLKNRTPFEKLQDTLVKWRRGFLLSSPTTLAKLTSAAIERGIFTPIEELAGGVLGRLPGIERVAARAPREGGFNVKAEVKAISDGITIGMREAARTLRTGKSDLDALYGRKDRVPRSVIDFFGSVHGALKTPTKLNEFSRSLEKRTAFDLRNGVDVTDPLVQTRLMTEAYKDASRSIFMQDNRVVAAYRRALSALEQKEKSTGKTPLGPKIGATTAKVLLPIVKVPTNIVAETMQYAVGSVTGSLRLGKALIKGVDKLAPEQADLIMRDLKKGSLGAALLLYGYFNSDVIGGYYQPGKRDPKDVKFGSIRLFGWDVPSYLVHNPLLETLQIGATIRRVADSKLRKSDKESQGIGGGMFAGALGLLDEVPFVRQMLGELPKIMDPKERGQYMGEFVKSLTVPQLFDWTARQIDKDKTGEVVKRKPETLGEHIESGIPGLRENVPTAEAVKKEQKKAAKVYRQHHHTSRPLH